VRLIAILLRSATVLLLSFLVATSSSAQSACNITLNVGEQGNVTAKRGETVTVCLPLTSGTGYSWKVQDGGDAMTLQPTSTFERNGPQPGASGLMRFTVKPATPGDYTLVLMLVPPGNTGAEAGRAFFGLKVL
jgi:predicted secreted protein